MPAKAWMDDKDAVDDKRSCIMSGARKSKKLNNNSGPAGWRGFLTTATSKNMMKYKAFGELPEKEKTLANR